MVMRNSLGVLCTLLCSVALLPGVSNAADEIAYTEGSRPPAGPGEVWCLVELPAQFKTVSEQVMVQPESCTFETVPAEFRTVQEQVCSRPASKRRSEIPAEYKTETFTFCTKKACSHTEKIAAAVEDR